MRRLQRSEVNLAKKVDPDLEKMYRRMAAAIIRMECDYHSTRMGVQYNKITIRDQKSRWGSCSSQGNLNFSWRLILMHPMVGRYVVVHELAHLKHMNHSKAFWDEVERAMPNYKKRKEWLKQNGYKYIRR
ncbi:MAG: M48 family metallopeptidase [Eubacteriales bacterium]